ncbi:MAG: hypothetical protein L6R41_006954 [Letrouitia leprolyta]|nr:MAG: hypothetical protein L6R41_006954 [Letrouitia leprolyta]
MDETISISDIIAEEHKSYGGERPPFVLNKKPKQGPKEFNVVLLDQNQSSQKRKRRASQILATDNTQDLATEDESTSLGRSLRRRHDPTPEAVNEPIFSTRSTSSRTPRNTSYANQGPSTGRYVATAVTESISSFEHTSPQDRLQGAAPRSMNAAKPSSGAQSDLSALFRDMERASEIRPGVQPGSTFTVSFAGQEN